MFGKRRAKRAAEAQELPEAWIGYKFADPSPKGFQGLAGGKPYGVDSEVKSNAMGFHSYDSLGALYSNIDEFERGSLLLEVLHYGEVRRYDKGYVSTAQRVLQVASSHSACLFCDDTAEYFVRSRFRSMRVLRFCRPHRAVIFPKLMRPLFRGKPMLIDKALEDMARSSAELGLKVIAPTETLEPTPHRKPE